ncbi:hypothetical protein BOTCAL_0005g00190 [Botryotinia calthae]|uniref:Uncharacterized protein n=1 Tax=Botryotinia calthae TaxID=38488 RepID=A0A4Y8DHQ2_9HELO|nr:hypothetical protein BOTCAL_0005g00190 [Botryotinia calthae]
MAREFRLTAPGISSLVLIFRTSSDVAIDIVAFRVPQMRTCSWSIDDEEEKAAKS